MKRAVLLSCADSIKLPPMLIFKSKTIPKTTECVIELAHEEGMMDGNGMHLNGVMKCEKEGKDL
jgi:hypothetical protein